MTSPDAPAETDVVLAVDVGGTQVKKGILGPGHFEVRRVPTVTAERPWDLERLVEIVASLHDEAVGDGRTPRALVVAVPGQVDEHHGAVQYSATLPWHDVAVGHRLAEVVPCEVIVRHSARVGALAESNLGRSAGEGTLLFVSLGAGIVAAGAQSGVVVADHVGAGDLGGMRIRSGPGTSSTLDAFASARAIAGRYAERSGADPADVDASLVHARIGEDPVAREVWDEAVDALADAFEWAAMLFGPRVLVIGGGLVDAGDDLMEPLRAGVARRFAGRDTPAVDAATFGPDAETVGAAYAGWRKLQWPDDALRSTLAERFELPD